MRTSIITLVGVIGLCTLMTPTVYGADTIETYDVGATNFELYTGLDGVGLGQHEKTVSGEILMGYGITDRFSGCFHTILEADEYLVNKMISLGLGIVGTVVDTDHFDVDLFLYFTGSYEGFLVTPAFEMNLDASPDMGSVGLYLRGGLPLYGRDTAEDTAADPDFELATQIDMAIGAYATFKGAHQLLIEVDSVFRPSAIHDERDVEIGGTAIGYNVMLTDNIELINQVYLDIPQNDESVSLGVSTGFIATLP